MQLILLFALVGSAFCQLWIPNLIGGDHIHDYTFEYHRTHDLLLVRNRDKCYLVDMTDAMKTAMAHHDDRIKLEDAIYAQIQAGTGATKVDASTLSQEYHDMIGALECRHHDTYKLAYSASSS